jgi:thioredoxin 1
MFSLMEVNLKNNFKRNKIMALKLINLNDTEFNKIITEGITLVDFWAPWYEPCRMQKPILEELGESIGDQAKIAKLNVDEVGDVAERFGVHAIPTLILFDEGKEVRRFIGVQSKETLISEIEKIL